MWKYSNVTATTHDKECTVCGYKVTGEAHNFVNNKCECGRYNTVTVHFDLNLPTPENGRDLKVGPVPETVSDITYNYGDYYYDPKYNIVTPELEDYVFTGWYAQVNGKEISVSDLKVTNADSHTLYAHWEPLPVKITSLTGKDIEVIENNGQSEADYRKDHEPETKLQYSYSDTDQILTAVKFVEKNWVGEENDIFDDCNPYNPANWNLSGGNGNVTKSFDNNTITISVSNIDSTKIKASYLTQRKDGSIDNDPYFYMGITHSINPYINNQSYHIEYDINTNNDEASLSIGMQNGGGKVFNKQNSRINDGKKNLEQDEWHHISYDFTTYLANYNRDNGNVYSSFYIYNTPTSANAQYPYKPYANGPVTIQIKNFKVQRYSTDVDITHYDYEWEQQDSSGNWKSLNSQYLEGNGLTIKVKNAKRDLDGTKIRLKVYNNAGKFITSNEMTINVYWLPIIK